MQTATLPVPKVSRAIAAAVVQVGGYTPAASTSAVITGLAVTNTSGTLRTVKVSLYDGANDTYLAFNAQIGVGDTLIVGGDGARFTLITGWSIRVIADAGTVDAAMSVTEYT